MSIDIPTTADLTELTRHRHAASVSLYATSGGPTRGPVGLDREAAQVAVRSAANDALRQLDDAGVAHAEREDIGDAIERLQRDAEFWETPARTIAVFVAPGMLRAFRLRNELPQRSGVGDRFDVGPLVRATTFGHRGFVLALEAGRVRLLALESDATTSPIPLDIDDDAALALETTATDGRFDRHSADGALGPKVGQRRYCSMVQDAVLAAIGEATDPLVLAAAADLDPAYREINSYPGLLERGLDANPASLDEPELAARGRAVLDEHFAAELADWREEFGTLAAGGRASAQLSDVARAASTGLVDTLLFDLEEDREGTIDDVGVIAFADEPGPATYGIVDEIAARVLQFGGTARAVRRDDLPADSPVAATFRGTL